jgi:phospholipase C
LCAAHSSAALADQVLVAGESSKRSPGLMSQLSWIQHVIVVMLENRSFDHMLGISREWQRLAEVA